VQELADKQAITELLYRYCRSVDRLDMPLGHSIWHDDAVADYPDYQGSGKGVIDHICKQHLHLLHHTHQLSNILIELAGDRAASETYATASLRMKRGETIQQIGVWCRYLDKWSRRSGRWGIDHRKVIIEFDEIRDVTPMQSYATGQRDRSDPSYEFLSVS
jgi:hypothetical protein